MNNKAVKFCKINELNEKEHYFVSSDYNYKFNLKTGLFQRWGKTIDDDPKYSIYGPEILDIEVTTQCKKGCTFCYKANTSHGTNMSFETFKTILDKMPITLTQIAFGVDAYAESNPDLWKMMEYARSKDIIPNLTVANINQETAEKIASLAGACAVSRYENKDECYDSVKRLTDLGMKQVNIHMMISKETYNQAIDTIQDIRDDSRLKDLNAIVFLSLKKKGRGKIGFTSLTQNEFNILCDFARVCKINYGFDSCGSSKYLKYIESSDMNNKEKENQRQCIEPCESSCFSAYINVDGEYSPCSFCDKEKNWEKGLDVVNCKSFIKDIWFNNKVVEFRDTLLSCNRNCPIFDI